MYRQRKRDLNLKPNRQLDKRSSRGMIYENEELRMRTIAICEDVDRGQSDIKKLRKENDHLKREIWGLRDECEKLEEILKKVCISANIPEFQLDVSSQKKGDDEDSDDDDEEDDEDDESSYAGGSDRLKTGDGERHRKTSGASVLTFDSDVGTCMTQMFSDDPGGGEIVGGGDTGFAADDPGSIIMNPECSASAVAADVICHPHPISPEPGPSTSFAHPSQPWSHPTAISPDLECVKEETESALSSSLNPSPTQHEHSKIDLDCLDSIVLPDPSLIMLPAEAVGEMEQQESTLVPPADGRKTPVIQITPASSPASNGQGTEPQSPTTDVNSSVPSTDLESVHNIGCITVVPKTFKVTSEIVVGGGNGESSESEQGNSKSEELPRKILKWPPMHQNSDPLSSDHIILNQTSLSGGINHQQRQSCYFPSSAAMGAGNAQTLPSAVPNFHHRSFGMLTGYSSCCCANDDPHHLIGGYQSEPSLNHTVLSTNSEDLPSFFNPFQCCRIPPSAAVNTIMTPLTIRSVWNTVDKNIVIGFYGVSGGGGGTNDSIEPNAQEIIDELEAQFDPSLENIQGIRVIPGRIFISLKSAQLVKLFLSHFKNDLVLRRKNTQQRIRIHFIEGATQKLTTTLVLSGIPQELSDLTVISSLNQFGQVVAPLERRNYKGVDISERIAKMHLVVGEESLPECMNVNGYNVRIKVEKHQDQAVPVAIGVSQPVPTRKYGFVPPASMVVSASTSTTSKAVPTTNPVPVVNPSMPSAPTLNPHKPVTRSSSSAPRLETPAPGTLTCPLPPVEQKRQSSVCAANIPADQHPSRLLDKQPTPHATQHKVTIANQAQTSQQSIQGGSTQTISAPNLQPPPKKPLARLLVSSPGSFTSSPPASGPVSPTGGESTGGGGLKGFCRSFDPRRVSSAQGGGASSHATLTPSSSYSPRLRRKSSVQFAGNARKRGKREPLPWCGCWGLGCGN